MNILCCYKEWNPSNQDKDTSINRTVVAVPYTILVYCLSHEMKTPFNLVTFHDPRVSRLEGFHCTNISIVITDVCVTSLCRPTVQEDGGDIVYMVSML